jgi:signal peptidase I
MTQTPTQSNSQGEANEKAGDGAKLSGAAEETTFLGYLRDWADALVIAFVVAMFIRMFVVELFKIPSGSMSPTLLGDWVAEGVATNREGESHQYLLIMDPMESVQVFEKQPDGYYDYQGKHPRFALTASQNVLLHSELHREEHRILVNKFAYWFKKPERGDVVIFRVPFKAEPYVYSRNGIDIPGHPYNRNESVYVKRAVAFGGERVEIRPDRHLYVNGKPVTEPEIVSKLQYLVPGGSGEYDITVPDDHLVVLGDNSDNSLDSRYWGPLPENNLRGKAVLRYWPFKDKWFLSPK